MHRLVNLFRKSYCGSSCSRWSAADHFFFDFGHFDLLGFGQFVQEFLIIGQAQLERPVRHNGIRNE